MVISGYNISMIRGDSETINVSCKNDSGIKVHLVEGDMIYFTVKTSPNTEKKTLQKVVTEFVDGEAAIEIFPADTQSLNAGSYFYDIQLNRANGQVKTIIPPSRFAVKPEVTYD